MGQSAERTVRGQSDEDVRRDGGWGMGRGEVMSNSSNEGHSMP